MRRSRTVESDPEGLGRADAEAVTDRSSERDEEFSTVSSLPIERLYTREDLGPDWNSSEKLGFPGEYPYTRGVHPTMYRGRLWTMRQFAGFGTAAADRTSASSTC